MNKLVKKSMAGLLAGVMAVTSLAVGSFSAMAKELPDASTAIALNQTVTFTKGADDVDDSKVPVYSFTPATSGYYAISFTSVVAPEADTVSGTDTITNQRADNSTLNIYEYDGKSAELGIRERYWDEDGYTYYYRSNYQIHSCDDYDATVAKSYAGSPAAVTATKTTKGYVNGYEVMGLSAQKTYYFFADLAKMTVVSTGATQYATANLTIAPADFTVDLEYNNATTKTATATGYEKVTTATPYYSVTYVGAAKDIVVPAQINGINVEDVSGRDSSYYNMEKVTSLTLGPNVKSVSGFSNMDSLATVVLNDGLETIGGNAFANNFALTGTLVIPASVKSIGSSAFFNTGYSNARVLSNTAEIGAYALGFKEAHDDNRVSPTETKPVVVPDFFIAATTGATAFAYGAEYGVEVYDPANCTHKFVVSGTKAATYFAKGSTTYTCAVCGATKTESIAKLKLAIKSVKSAKKGQITVTTDAPASKITGYQIKYSTSKKFTKKTTKTVTVKSKKALKKTIKGLKSGKYYVKVRVQNGKKNSAFTAVKSVKVK